MYNQANALYAEATVVRGRIDSLKRAGETEGAAAAQEELQKIGQELIESSEFLLEHDPLNTDAKKLQGEGYRITRNQDKLVEIFTDVEAAPVSVAVVSFKRDGSGAKLTIEATGRQPHDIQGKNVKSTPVTIAVEFLDDGDQVVDTGDLTIPVLAPATSQEFSVEGTGPGISWWRYHRVP